MPSPLDLHFTEVHRERVVRLVADELVPAEDAASPASATGPRTAPPTAAPTAAPAAPATAPPTAPYVGATTARARTGVLRAGLDLAGAEHDGRRVRLVAGGRELAARRVRLPVGASLGAVLCERHLTAFVGRGGRWRPVLTARLDGPDPRDPAVLGAARWCDPGPAAGEVRRGPFGQVGVRDPHLVTHADGSAYVREARVFLTMTCSGPGGFRQAHWGVFSLDPARPGSLERVAALYSRRDGLVLGDHAGHLVRDGDRWLVATSSWGDFDPDPGGGLGVHVRWATSTEDLLHGVHVLDTAPAALPVPAGTAGTWDPALLRTGDGWLVAHVEAESLRPMRFRPATASTGAQEPFDSLRRLVAVGGPGQTEGPLLLPGPAGPLLLASDGDRRSYVVADPSRGTHLGDLDAPYGSNIPHPQLLARDDGSWLMVTFDGTPLQRRRHRLGRAPLLGYGTHGDLVVLAATP